MSRNLIIDTTDGAPVVRTSDGTMSSRVLGFVRVHLLYPPKTSCVALFVMVDDAGDVDHGDARFHDLDLDLGETAPLHTNLRTRLSSASARATSNPEAITVG